MTQLSSSVISPTPLPITKTNLKMIIKIKVFISKIIASNLAGAIISKLFSDKIPFYESTIFTTSPEIKNSVKALIFWKIYESSEVRFVRKYLKGNLDIVELGSSIGVLSVQLGKSKGNKKMINVEASPKLIPILNNNLLKNEIQNYSICNCAIGKENEKLWFEYGEKNTGGKITEKKSGNGEYLSTKSLKSILVENNISEYMLVCDIEGAELALIKNEPKSFSKCKVVIMEAHSTSYEGKNYSPEDIKQELINLGFSLLEEHGPNFVLIRKL